MWNRLILTFVGSGFLAALCAQPAAVIASSEGNATVTDAEHRSKPAHCLDWLPSGVQLETSLGAHLVLAFSNGRRYELGPAAKVFITAEGPAGVSGPFRELEKLPPMPKLPVIAMVSGSAAMGGMRIREVNKVRLIFPVARLSTLPDHTVLRFAPAESGARYKIEIADVMGNVLYQSENEANSVAVFAGVLKPGLPYVWRVRAITGEVLGQASFTTLSAEAIAARAAFKAAIPASDVDSQVLLAAIDAQLGLFDEAHDELRASIARTAHPEAVRKLLDVIEDTVR